MTRTQQNGAAKVLAGAKHQVNRRLTSASLLRFGASFTGESVGKTMRASAQLRVESSELSQIYRYKQCQLKMMAAATCFQVRPLMLQISGAG
jgi:hypothetical protein